jgi:amino acid transporter
MGDSRTLTSGPRKLSLLPLVMVFYFTVSGGAYGLEDLVGFSGPGISLALIAVTALIWSLPIALMSAELSAALPVVGGYYAWVKRALGPFWGFQEGWWSWLASFPAMAIYPVLFADYLAALLAETFGYTLLAESALARWLAALVVIWGATLLNLRGAPAVGVSSNLFGLFILAPFAVMTVGGLARLAASPRPIWQPVTPPGADALSAFGVGLFIVMWKYTGFDAVSTINEEIHDPARNYLRACLLTIPLIVLTYLLPVAAGLAAQPDWTQWTAGQFPVIAAAIGGPWLGAWLALGGLASFAGQFNALLLSMSRLPFAMAEDGYLPPAITRQDPRTGTPTISILVCGVLYSVFSLSAFAWLVVITVVLYAVALILEFAALIALRVREPDLPRPYRVPGGLPGAIAIAALPGAVLALAVVSQVTFEGPGALYLSLAALATGPILYLAARRRTTGGNW